MAEGSTGVTGGRAVAARSSRPGPPSLRVAVVPRGSVRIRGTAPDALSNLVAVLELAADGQLRCAAATRRPLAATVRLSSRYSGEVVNSAGFANARRTRSRSSTP